MRMPCVPRVLLVCIIAGAFALPARAGEEEPVIQDRPLSEWIADLQTGDTDRRLMAAWAIGSVGAEAAPAVPALIELLSSEDPVLRLYCVSALAGMGAAAKEAAPRLQELLHDPNAEVRGYAEMALMEMGASTTPTGGVVPLEPTESLIVPEPQVPADDPGPTLFLQPLRNHEAALQALEQRMTGLAAHPPQDPAQARRWATDLKQTGRDLIAEARAFNGTLHSFINSRTRRGLTEELEVIDECIELTVEAGEGLETRSGFDIAAYAAAQQLRQESAAVRTELITMLATEVDDRLEAEGLLALLATEGIGAVKTEVMSRLRTGAEQELDRITQRELGLAFHDARSFRAAVRQRARDAVRRQVGKLLFRITGNQIIVELLGAPIINWLENDLWPRLREAFRHKGNLEARTDTSIASLERARMRLWRLPNDATIDRVQATLRGARGSLGATRYLVGDLQNAGRAELLARLEATARDLQRAMSITEKRFLLHKLETLAGLGSKEEVMRALIAVLEAMVAEIDIPDALAQAPEGGRTAEGTEEGVPTQEVERIEFTPHFLIHIIETSTMSGPQERDVWILHPERPNEDGVVLTADGSGGWFINRADQTLGPYTSNFELCPVLVGLGVGGISLGRQWISADPAIWGEGN